MGYSGSPQEIGGLVPTDLSGCWLCHNYVTSAEGQVLRLEIHKPLSCWGPVMKSIPEVIVNAHALCPMTSWEDPVCN